MSIQPLPISYYSGLSGLQLPIPKHQFSPPHQASSRLTYYATFFNSIEVNSSFYKIPRQSTVAKWAASVSDDFRFTFKLFRDITHVKNLKFDPLDVMSFIQAVSAVGDRRGSLLVQFPPGLKSDAINELDKLLSCLRSADPENLWKVAVEFRNRGWYNEDVYGLLDVHGCALVTHDIPASATPFTGLEANTVYVRFHGPTGNYRGNYTDDFLLEYASYIREWMEEGKSVFVYFNNTMGNAFANLATLNGYLGIARSV